MTFDEKTCEKIIGYVFKDKGLLSQCFTHASYSNEHKNAANNERLEFLGDSLLGFIVTDFLYKEYGAKNEGRLTSIKRQIVSKEPLSHCILSLGLERFILFGNGEANNSKQSEINVSENLFEAIVGGIYLDGGIAEARKFIYDKLIQPKLFDISKPEKDYKSELQIFIQKNHLGAISYETIDSFGAPHEMTFVVSVKLNGLALAEGVERSKQKAQQLAAEKALLIIKNKS